MTPLHHSYEDSDGGQFELTDEAGNRAVLFGADSHGTGGRLQIQRDATYSADKGIDLNGNWASSEEPALRVMGSPRSANFRMDLSGNDSVQLPLDAIYDQEILDEPGVASDELSGSLGLTSSYAAICARSINVPASGYVLALAKCQIRAVHYQGTMSDADLGDKRNESRGDSRVNGVSSPPKNFRAGRGCFCISGRYYS